VEDVEASVKDRVPVHLLGMWGRHTAGSGGVIHPERVVEEAERLYER